MDMSDQSSTNSSDLDTMGSILATSNENNSDANETDKIQDEPSLTSEHVEVSGCQTEKIRDISDDIDLLSMSKSSDSVIEQHVLPQTSSSVDNLNISESDDNVEDLWLASDTRELVKVETDEDFDVIVKSLETAIVGADKVPIMSPILVPESSVESDLCDPVLLDELGSPPSLSELAVDTSKLPSAVSDQCLESLIDPSIITGEFSALSDETFDEESTSLFETTDAVSELTNIDSRPSLLELQEADMTCDIAETIDKDILPLIKDTLLNDDSLDGTEDILNNIVHKNIDGEAQIEEAVDEEILEFPETENINDEMLNKSLDMDQQLLTERSVEIKGEEIVEKREEIAENDCETSEANATEENVDKSEINGDEVTKTDKSDSKCEEMLSKEEEIMETHEAKSDINIIHIENLTDVDIFDETEPIIENAVNIPLEMTQEDEPEVHSSETKTEEETLEDLEPDLEENIKSVPLELTENLVVSSQSEIKAQTQEIEPEISETSTEQLPGEENQEELSLSQENVRVANVSVVLEDSSDKVRVISEESVDKVRCVLEESVDSSSVKVDENNSSGIVEESVDSSRVQMDDKLSLAVEEDIILSPVAPNKCTINPEQIQSVSDNSQVTSVKPVTESSPPIDKPQDYEDNIQTSTSSSETQSSIVEDQVKQVLDRVEKEQSPPKKIKLIREKLYIPPVNISTVLPSLDTLANVMAKVVSSENVTELNNSKNIKIFSAEIKEDVSESSKDQQFVEKTSPVRTRKLKLKRDYEPEQIVTRQFEDCATKDTEEMPSVVLEEESVKPTSSETISDTVTVQCESPNITEEPKAEQDNKMVSKTELKSDEEIKMVSETDLKSDDEIVTAVDNRLEVNISRDKNTQMITEPIKSAETGLLEVNVEGSSEIGDSKQIEGPEDDTISQKMPVTCAIDVPTAFDEYVPITEDIPKASDAEKPSKSPESVSDCEETPVEIICNSEGQANPEESPENSSKSPEPIPGCEETTTGIISNSPVQANPEECPENASKSPEPIPGCEERHSDIICNSPEQANPEETPENSSKSPESVSDCEEPSAGIISNNTEQVKSKEKSSAILVTSTEVLAEQIAEESVVIPEKKSSSTEEKSSGIEATPLAAPEMISLPVETKLSILQQMLMKDVVVPTKEKSRSRSVVDQPSSEPMKECETPIVRSENELTASEIERVAESTIDDELMQAAKAVETRIDASEENDDELKQAAQEAETRDEHADATLEANEAEFEDNSVSICEDEIIAVTQALEMERAQENRVEISKTESLLGICKEKTVILDAECQPSLEATVRQEIVPKPSVLIEQIKGKLDGQVEDNKLKRHAAETPSPVAAKKSKSNKDAETTFGRKMKASPVTEDSVSIEAMEVVAKHSVTIEPISSQSRVENVGKLRISRRKLEEPALVKSVTITKPLRVEVDDLGNSSMSPSYFSDLPSQRDVENVPKIVIKPIPKPEERSSPKITIKPILKPSEMVLSPKTSKSKGSDDACTPRITIKPIVKPDPLKITITKQKMDDTHSILKIYKPDDGAMPFEEKNIPKLTIKPISKSDEMQHSPRITIKPVKPPNQHSPSTSMSPKITVKPVMPPSDQSRLEISHSPKITVKSVQNPEDSYPKVTIKPILRPDDSARGPMSPRQIKLKTMTFESSSGVTVEPIAQLLHNVDTQASPLKISVKSFAKIEETLSPKLTIRPITKTCEIVQSEDGSANPLKLTIKPILKPEESYQSPKITIKPIMKPEKLDQGGEEMDKPERIILKIQKTNLPSPKERAAHSSKESRKEPEVKIEAILPDPERNQKLDKIKLKLTKEGSHAQIIPSVPSMLSDQFTLKRPLLFSDTCIAEKRSRGDFSGTELLHNSDISINLVEPNAKPHAKTISEEVTIVKLDRSSSSVASPLAEHISQSKFKEMLLKIQQKADITCTPHIEDNSSSSDDVKIVGVGILGSNPLKDPLSIHDESSEPDVVIVNEVINTNPFHNVQIINAHTITDASAQQTPKKRGRPRKNPLEVKPEIKGEDCVEIVRPKRTCRAPPGRTPFAVKERKPRGAGRGRGGRGRGGSSPKSPKEPKTPRGKALKEAKALAKLEAAKLAQEVVIDAITIEDSTNDTTPIPTPVPPVEDVARKPVDEQEMVETEVKLTQVREELLKEPQQHLPPPPIAVYEEETRMSADNSRAQTPARQVIAAPQLEGPEESQSSVQSSATTESNKNKKGRLEVCDPDSAVTTVEQIVEYSWGPGGTYMLQEQIAQFLGVKSFKRKYPGLTRRPVEMQERDYIREKGLVSESMCDMGLTAVPSSEILDIMYTDFQEKYEEYRKCMRDKQSKEISNKQKAISLATSQEKNKIDFKERAIRSAANWNVNFNKSRKESRRCCMDLQTFTINFPLGRTQCKTPQKSPVGQYPIALVPGQFTDYYKRYTSNELHYLPLNTVRYGPVMPNQHCTDAGQSDGSQSDTDSSSGSDSDSSDDSMSTVEDTPAAAAAGFGKAGMNLSAASAKAKVH